MHHLISVLVFCFLGMAVGWLVFSLGRLWGDYVSPAIRSWRYERRMEKARQQFLHDLYRELEKEKRAK